MSRQSTRDFINLLDPQKDFRRINYLLTCCEFPFDMARALELALFRTFASPTGAAILDSTGEFGCRPQKRYDDTDIVLNEMLETGLSSPRGRTALRRMNVLHRRYDISNEDFVYVLSTFVCDPIRWIDRYGWRKLTEKEKQAIYFYWLNMGRHMNIRNIPPTLEELEHYNVEYERTHFRYSEATRRIAESSRDMFLNWAPAFIRPAGKWVIYAMLDEPVLSACGFPDPPTWLRNLVRASLKARGVAARFGPRLRRARLRTVMYHRSYPHGYRLEEIGAREPSPDNPHLRSHGEARRATSEPASVG